MIAYTDLSTKLNDLRSKYDLKCAELAKRQADLQAAKIKSEELRQCLEAAETKRTSLVPVDVRAGLGAASMAETELQRILTWIAEHVVLKNPISFNACCMIVTGDQQIHLSNIVQWRLTGELRLSVPEELAAEVSNFLSAAKTNSSIFSSAKAKTIVDSWQVTQCEDVKSRMTLLTHQASQSSCIVANFPVPPLPSPERLIASKLAFESRCSNGPLDVSIGDHVEVNFEGEWFAGTVCDIKGGLTYVHCDIDPPDVLTTAPIHMLRRPIGTSSTPDASHAKSRHARARQASI